MAFFQPGAFQANAFQGPIVPVDGVGDAGAATSALAIEAGATISLEWKTDITESISGLEQRAACRGKPRLRIEFSSLLSDAQHRHTLSLLAGMAAAAPQFLIALPYEDLSVVSSTSSTILVSSLALCDWAVPGQRIVVVSPVGEMGEAVIQLAAGETLSIDADLTAVAVEGARVMPAIGVLLESEQGFSRYQVNLGRWDLAARAVLPGYGASTIAGTGAAVTRHDDMPVWDRGVAKRQAEQPLLTGVELADLGGRISALSSYTQAAWTRAMRHVNSRRAEWQWLKLFLDTIQGRRRAFLLPTGRPDLVPIGDASSGTLTVEGPPVANAPDYAGDWFPSLAHRRLRLLLVDGTVAYRTVIATAAATGSQDLALAEPVVGAIARVEFLETCRLASDTVSVTWTGSGFETQLAARVVQQ